ncbi:cytochrome p450 [Mycobacterium leprae TN] [Mycolicibacterium parafortuitum]|uniref:Steroid C26-monooxygenase n=2 Tax=Mycolicibacterium parafortuitum TaxID=39692 RepID=A0A375YCF0_MYCPF|nr:cytochrome p450 [Mycobacterium leprae TN] [Mycolicibacterium parafortuitum]
MHNKSMTTAADPQSLLLTMLDPAVRADPYPLYAQIRARGPLQLPANNLTVFSTYAACDEVLRHPDAASDRLKSTIAQRAIADGAEPRPFGPPGFLFLDPPDHTRLRRLVSKAFVPKVVKALEPEIVALVDGLLRDVDGTFDAIAGLAYPLPVAVICRLLGVPLEDEPEFSAASALLAQSLDPFATVTGSAGDGFEERMRAGRWLRGYLRDLIARRRRDPGEDLMSGLIHVEESGDQLTEDEIVATCNLLLVAGHETTVNLIANAILALLRHDGQWAALAADADRAAPVIEETLRYDPPVQLVGRIAAEDMTITGVTVPKGDNMMLLTAAAHRDPDAVQRPDEFDPDRETIRHLGFGKGPHFCIGAPLARLEATVALTALTSRFPTAALAGEPGYKPNVTLRGMTELPITL